MSSKSGRDLAHSLGAIRVYPDRNYRQKQNHTIINWGNSSFPNWYAFGDGFLNHPYKVSLAANKRKTFDQFLLKGVDHLDWTDDTECAQSWVDGGSKVYGRKTLTGHSGSGIIIFDAETITTPQECPLYTLETKAKYEYRIHLGNNGDYLIDSVMKKKKSGHEGGIRGIRNHSNGWIYAREGVVVPPKVMEASIKAIKALDLDFGAVDVGYNANEDKAYVYEVNTAPGLVGTTLEHYTKYFKDLL